MSREYQLRPFSPAVDLQIDYARELNTQQLAAVTAPPGPALVLAGAGSGKTRTLIYRVAYLLEQGVPADRLLLLTFTNKAAKEMMRRAADLLGHDLTALWGGTFHSIANRILHRHADRVGYRPDFTILDREDAKVLLNACLAETGLDFKATRFPKPEALADIFSLAVNTHQSIAVVLGQAYEYFAALAPQIADVAQRYAARKRATNVMDFDDLLVYWLQLVRDDAEIGELYQRRFQFLLVDEYQDTNQLQSDLIDRLAARHRNVMAVGDDAQSIYSWRGANFRNILEFPKRYPEARVFRIENNYRSTPEILHLANAAIATNQNQFAKNLAPVRASGIRPVLVVCQDAGEQAAFVAQRILELREEGVALPKMAVLYRSHFHALELQMELTRRNIPFRITSGLRFFEQAHIKDVAAYLKLVSNPLEELAFKRIALMLPGIGALSATKLWRLYQTHVAANPPTSATDNPHSTPAPADPAAAVSPPSDAATSAESTSAGAGAVASTIAPHEALAVCQTAVPRKARSAWTQWIETMRQLGDTSLRNQPAAMIQLVVEAVYAEYLRQTYAAANAQARREDVEQLAVFARQFADTTEFLSQLALLSNLDAESDRGVRDDEGEVKLSTIHQAKGLEFDVVFLIMLCEGMFPNTRALRTQDQEEEERRLFYVAVTRARNELYLSYPLIRLMGSQGGDFMQRPSRFLREIPAKLREEVNLRPYLA